MKFPTKPSRRETIFGGIYLIFYIAVMPWLVSLLVYLSGAALTEVQVNFLYFGINFAATTVIFRKYLLQSLFDASHVPGATLWYAILGYLGNMVLSSFLAGFILRLEPEFANINDMTIHTLVSENLTLMAIGVVILAPITEELLFRGLIFRGLYDRSPLAAHLVSIAAFSSIHVSGYVGFYDAKTLVLCFLQYLPAAYCLNFAYRRSGSIIAPILMHMLTNLVAISAMR
jgi:membrane protease YdiL (CAAX protease family)